MQTALAPFFLFLFPSYIHSSTALLTRRTTNDECTDVNETMNNGRTNERTNAGRRDERMYTYSVSTSLFLLFRSPPRPLPL
jgi:hypothetical protein